MESSTFDTTTLPLCAGDKAVFASIFTLLAPSDAHTPASAREQHSPREGAHALPPREEHDALTAAAATLATNTDDANDYSALFALLSPRAAALVVVLQNHDIVVLGVCHVRQQLVELRRMRPRPYHARHAPGHRGERAATSSVTTASLLPLELASACRVAMRQHDDGSAHDTNASAVVATATTTTHNHDSGYTYLRGVVGCSDGIVSVFSERGYAYTFFAHDAPVLRAEAVYCSGEVDGAAEGAPHAHDAAARQHTLYDAMRHLGIVTESVDGQLFLWRRVGGTVAPSRVAEAGIFARHVAFAVCQPASTDRLLSQTLQHRTQHAVDDDYADNHDDMSGTAHTPTAVWHANDTRDAAMLLQPSLLLHSTSTLQHVVQLRVLDEGSTANDMAATRRSSYKLPGSQLTYTTALATTPHFALVARDKQLYVLEYATGSSTLIMTAHDTITSIVVDEQLALACCGDAGRVYVLQLSPFAVLGTHRVAKKTRLQSCTLSTRTLTMLLVTHIGVAHVVKLPDSYLADANTPDASTATKRAHAGMDANVAAAAAVADAQHQNRSYDNKGSNTQAHAALDVDSLRTRCALEGARVTADAVPLGDYNEPIVSVQR